ncbi:hypothetical protein HPB50_021058 [Hyalomma asiaticum]|uniref:Uncharacterized protein n=1 Tax=Hyalomma asiaticum TaxID=266040 RepID=A0ACB7SAK0_HYAAI|nr:hypothetical protein HPB50_021058 [Hyalomma asiaticum]
MDGIFGSDDSREASSAGSRSASPASSEGSRTPAQHSDDGEQSEHSDAEERSEKSYHSSPPRSPASGDESGYEDKGEEASGDERRDSGDEGSDESRHVDDQSGDEEATARTPARSERSDSDAESTIGRKRRRSGGSEAASAASAAEGSDDDEAVTGRKRARISSTEEKGEEAEVEALFGEDLDDLSSDEEGAAKKKDGETPVKRMGSDEEEEPEEKRTEPEQGEEEEVPVPETRIDVEIPRIMTNLGNEVHFVKLPNFLSVDTRPYDPQWYEDEVDEDEVLDEEGRARLKLKVENTVRWRYVYDKMGNPVRQSNARIIKWSDGRRVMSLHLGSEIFDVHKQSLMQGDHNHLFIRQGTGLQGQAVFRTKLSFRQVTGKKEMSSLSLCLCRPHSTDSFTHRKMTLSLAGRSQKTQKIRVLPQVGQDPEAHRSEMIKKEEDKLRASIRRESKQRRLREKSHSRGLSAAYLEADEDDAAISLSAIKNKYRRGGAAAKERPSIYSSDDDASDLEEQRARRLEKAKAGPDNDDDDSDLDYFDKKAESKKAKKAIEESDEDD